ncbi:MAG: hypothetical protein WD530_01595 [Vicingaceae bacterium]
MNNWTLNTNEEFNNQGFNVFLENPAKYLIDEWTVYLTSNYPRKVELADLGADLDTIDAIYEVLVIEDNSGMMSLSTPKDSNKVISVSNHPVNGLIVVSLLQSDESIVIQSYSYSKGKIEKPDDQNPEFPL